MSRCFVFCGVFGAVLVCTVFSSVLFTPLHAAPGRDEPAVRCFHIDPVKGDDGNDGSLEDPWRSFVNIISYYKAEYRPSGWVELKPGDCIYLMDGVYNKILHPGEWKKGPGGGGSFVAYFRGRRGDTGKRFQLKAYPGHKPVIDPQGKGIGISIFQSSHWDVAGIEVKNAYQRGVSLNESKEVTLGDVVICDTDGVDNNNIAGLYITDCWNVEVYDCVFNDNYDRTCADTNGRSTENSCNVVIFGGMQGGNITIHDCFIYNQTTAFSADGFPGRRAGGGIKYKHASRIPDAFFRVHHNVFRNLSFFAFGSGTANTHFHDNVIAGPGGISSRDFGGITHQVNQVFENNRIYGTWGFAMNPTMRWRNDKFPDDPKNIVFGNNVVYDTAKAWSKERGIIMIGTYMSDEVYKVVAKELHLAGNSYYNPDMPVQFNIAAGFNYKEGYASGGIYALKEWQNRFGYDSDSVENDTFEVDWRHAVNPVR